MSKNHTGEHYGISWRAEEVTKYGNTFYKVWCRTDGDLITDLYETPAGIWMERDFHTVPSLERVERLCEVLAEAEEKRRKEENREREFDNEPVDEGPIPEPKIDGNDWSGTHEFNSHTRTMVM